MNPISVYEYIHEHLPRQVFSDLQSRVGEIVKSCFQQLETFFSWVASSFSKWLYKTDAASTYENSISLTEPLDFESSFENLKLQCIAASPEDDLVDHAMTTLKLAHTQEECATIKALLESLEAKPKLSSCIEMATRKGQTLDPDLPNSQKVLKLVLLAQESVESRLVITEGDFQSIEPICASYEGVEDAIAPYDLFLLAHHSETIFASLQWSASNGSPIGLITSPSAIEQVAALLKGQRLELTEDEQMHLLEVADQLLLDLQGMEALFPFYFPFLKNEERTLSELAQFMGFTPISCAVEMDQILSDALWKAILNLEDVDISTIESLRKGLCSSHSFRRAKKAFSILVIEVVERNPALIDKVGEFPLPKLKLSENNLSLLQNPFILKNLVSCRIEIVGSDDFYRRALDALQGSNLERLSISFNYFQNPPLELLRTEYQENQEMLLACLSQSDVFDCASDQLKNDRDFVLKAVQRNVGALEYASDRFKNDREVVLAAVQRNGYALKYASDRLKNDREVLLKAVQSNGYALEYASNRLKNDREVVLAAVQSNGCALEYASDRLKNDREVVLAAVQSNGYALKYASDEFKNDREVVLKAVQSNGSALEYASDRFKSDREVVLAAVQSDGYALEYASNGLKNDKEVVLKAVQSNGYALKYASNRLKNDKEIVLKAVQSDGSALKYASNGLKNDKEIVLKAVQSDGSALEYASNRLKNDKEVVLKAVQTHGLFQGYGRALEHASNGLKNDKEIVLKAVQSHERALKYASNRLKNDREVVWAAYLTTRFS